MATTLAPVVDERVEDARVAQVRPGWPEWICLGIYGCLVAVMICWHEPWSDEAQAWMLARSLSLWDLFHTYLHYEGSPGLWHLLLWIEVRLHVSYAGMHWIAGAIAVCGMWVLLRYAPFPRWLKFAIPFSFFFAYQYAVIARNYVLAPLLLFGVAALWKKNPVWLAVLLGLLANVAGHGAAIAGGFALAYARELLRSGDRDVRPPKQRDLLVALAVFLVLCGIATYTAFPAPDVWVGAYHPPAGEVVQPLPLQVINRILRCVLWPWEPFPLGFLAWPLIFWGFKERRALHFILPVIFCFLFSAIYVELWHAGLTVPAVLAALWITWPVAGTRLNVGEVAMRYAIGLLIATGIVWTARAFVYEHGHDYSGDAKAAHFLKPIVDGGGQVAVGWVRDTGSQLFHAVGIAPYFPGRVFMNQATPFYPKNTHDRTEDDFLPALGTHPQAVVLEFVGMDQMSEYDPARDLKTPNVVLVEHSGYRLARVFCGARAGGNGISSQICHLIFLPVPAVGK